MIFAPRKKILKTSIQAVSPNMSLYKDIQKRFMKKIKAKIKENQIGSGEDLLEEIKEMATHYHKKEHLGSMTNKFLIALQADIKEAKRCVDCVFNYYQMDGEAFASVCNYPHSIVWAKFTGEPFWPAKVLQVFSDQGMVEVKFFGTDHQKTTLNYMAAKPVVYHYSRGYPTEWWKQMEKSHKDRVRDVEEAIRECKTYERKLAAHFKDLLIFRDQFEPFRGTPLYIRKTYEEDEDPESRYPRRGPIPEASEALKLEKQVHDSPVKSFTPKQVEEKLRSTDWGTAKVVLERMTVEQVKKYSFDEEFPGDETEEEDEEWGNMMPGLNLEDMKESDDGYEENLFRFCTTQAAKRVQAEAAKRALAEAKEIESLQQKVVALEDRIKKTIEETEKAVDLEKKRRNREQLKMMSQLERETCAQRLELENEANPEILEQKARHQAEILAEKKKPYCVNCFSLAIPAYSATNPYCSKECLGKRNPK